MAHVNQSDLDRLGITCEQLDAHRARMAAEPLLEVRVAGGFEALRDALKTAGIDYSITDRTPKAWTH